METFVTDDRTAVAIVFERINRLGIELDTLQLLSAWTWNDEFDLQEEFADLAEELGPFGFRDVGEDSDLLLRCCAAIISGEASPQAIINLKGSEVRERFGEIRKGVLGAVDFLRNSFRVYSANILPFPSILIPLSVYFATDKDQDTHPSAEHRELLETWIWKTFFSRRYSKRLEQLNDDIEQIRRLRLGKNNTLGRFAVDLDEDFFIKSQFNLATANTRTFVLMLAREGPLDFINGGPISLDPVLRNCNKREFHHVYPRKFLQSNHLINKDINAMVNFVILSKAGNNKLAGNPPSVYRANMPAEEAVLNNILDRCLCPRDMFGDDYGDFCKKRAAILVRKAMELMRR